MPFPRELRRSYKNEHDFTRNFLHQLLQKLGFAVVVDYHGAVEYGKDLVFVEMDRFGHLRYHGLQARFRANIGLQEMRDLVESCKQAFANPFRHPHTGQKEAISGFYAVNGGSFSDTARAHYFASLVPLFHQNARLIDGESLLQLDRWSWATRVDTIRNRITGLLCELSSNVSALHQIEEGLRALREGESPLPPPERIRTTAVDLYEAEPFIFARPALARYYADRAARANKLLDMLCFATDDVTQSRLCNQALDYLCQLPSYAHRMENHLMEFAATLGPAITSDGPNPPSGTR